MNKKETEIILHRIKKWYKKLPEHFIYDKIPFKAACGWSKEPTPFSKRLSLNYKPVKEGDLWGKKWESAWFHLNGNVPQHWEGKAVYADLDFSGEGLVHNSMGVILQGITNGSIWDKNFARRKVPIIECSSGKEKIELWVEASASSLFGVYTDEDPERDSPKRHGWFDAKVDSINFGLFNEDLWHLYLDSRILLGLLERIDNESVRYARIISAFNNCLNVFLGDVGNSKIARKYLEKELAKPASPSNLKVCAVGHAHIDTAWLWPVRETIRKCARTFANQLGIIDKYPDYIFGASQPQHYQFIKDYYPSLYSRIKKAVASGNWEPQGGMWVEADSNLISGESLIRQILHGKNFFKDEFDVEVDNLWLPDVFGYSPALPQILKRSGIDFFLTQKLSWSQFNDFPHHTFNWRGIDGSEVLTHFPPENTYNSELDTEFLIPAQKGFKEKHKLDEFISLFGVGNGGGGPKPENIELGMRMANLENAPKVKFDTAKNFFNRLEKNKDLIETWVGELYLELHRGTLTTHGLVKKQNRKLEWKLRSIEILWSCLPVKKYPSEALDRLWKKLMINQFHDIIPGSSINMVYQTTYKEYEEMHEECDRLIMDSSNQLFIKDKNTFVLSNTLSYSWEGFVEIPGSFDGFSITNEMGKSVKTQKLNGKIIGKVKLEPLTFSTFSRGPEQHFKNELVSSLILENDLIRYEFDKNGRMISAYDKDIRKEFLLEPGNVLSLYEDRPNNWDAWDIDFFYRDAKIQTAEVFEIRPLEKGNVACQLKIQYLIGESKIKQNIILQPHSKRIDFSTNVAWSEDHKMLRVHFPVNIRSEQASFDIQNGYVKRNTHQNTSWDKAKFEVVGHKYADLSDKDYGVALLNDCKYGYMVHDNIIDLNLLRSPTNPDPDADKRHHDFTYSFFPHRNDLINSETIQESNCLNQRPLLFNGFRGNIKFPLKLDGAGCELSVLKKAEKGDYLIIRIVETNGRRSKVTLHLKGTLIECDLIEWNDLGKKKVVANSFTFNLNAFEIRTYKFFR